MAAIAREYSAFTEEELNGRFENYFPLIFLGDKIKVSQRWAGKKNPDEGREGTVVSIEHGFQSLFNRDYLIFTMKEDLPDKKHFSREIFDAWLYTLDLKGRTKSAKNIDGIKRPAYIDDTVEASGRFYRVDKRACQRSENVVGNIRKLFFTSYNPLEKIRAEVRNKDGKTYFVPYDSLSLVETFPPNDRFKV